MTCGALPSPPATASSAGDSAAPGEAGGFRARKRSLSVGGENACGAFFARQIEQYGLAAVLTSPVATCYFLASVIEGYSPESLLFYLEAEHFRGAAFGAEDRRARYARGLYKAFVSSRAPLEVNITHAMRARVALAFRAALPVPAALFHETQAHVYALLEQDYALFRQRPLYARMMDALASPPSAAAPRKDARVQHARAVAAVHDALTATYGVLALPASKARLVQSEVPSFTKFADMDLTSADSRVALPAWLCRTTIRLLDTALPASLDDVHVHFSAAVRSPPTPTPKLPSKQKSFQRLRLRFQQEAPPAAPDTPLAPPLPSSVKSRWDALWSLRRRKP
ncbi:hypothetical protein GGI04_003507 [Coemansia thaxteri]|uniref:RGS domain-containing protein n=1 Tax=Coemansia thaxteri TaxID=2663907 RepID=A0A9W8BF91_9FUNG|nr:hypothetical protein H4R26_004249 [Coemansia thaxteri]KAJ2002031.1 hypothetical protein GGI04_003507 [Coemansia thaxteri]